MRKLIPTEMKSWREYALAGIRARSFPPIPADADTVAEFADRMLEHEAERTADETTQGK